MVVEACLPSNVYFSWTPDYTPFNLGPSRVAEGEGMGQGGGAGSAGVSFIVSSYSVCAVHICPKYAHI